jgi:hypothetical protein
MWGFPGGQSQSTVTDDAGNTQWVSDKELEDGVREEKELREWRRENGFTPTGGRIGEDDDD